MLNVHVTGVAETIDALRDLAHDLPAERRVPAPRKMTARGHARTNLPEYWVAASVAELGLLGVTAFEREISAAIDRQGLG